MAPLKKTTSNASTASLPVASDPVAMPAPPGGPIEIVFSFDTTGSMSRCLGEVRRKVEDTIQRLFADIPNLRIAIFAHGDYGDTYVTKHVDFTNDVGKLCSFVNKVGSTGGGDWEECYELVLKQTRELLSWTPHTQRAMVMIGDAIPHRLGDARNLNKIDWKEEAEKLRDELGVRVYAVQAYDNVSAREFWEGLAKMTHGKHLNLGQFDTIVDMLMAICYREHGPDFFEAYEREVRARDGAGLRKELDTMFNALRDGDSSTPSLAKKDTLPSASLHAFGPLHVGPAGKRRVRKGGARRKPASPSRKLKTGGGVVKKTKATRASKRILKRTYKRSVTKSLANDDHIRYSIGRQRRETVGSRAFAFRGLDWTDWQQAMVNSKSVSGKSWIARRGLYSVRKFPRKIMQDIDTPAVYEFAVQPREGGPLRPVYVTSSGCVRRGKHWDSRVLRNRHIKGRFANSLSDDPTSRVWLRKVLVDKPVTCDDQVVNSVAELRKLMKQTYDYSWNKSRV